jgi:hypothetical protein
VADNKLGLNSYALFTIAKTMREQNKEPNELMSYSEHSGAVATYAVINALESISVGLKAEEDRQYEATMARYQRSLDIDRKLLGLTPKNP